MATKLALRYSQWNGSQTTAPGCSPFPTMFAFSEPRVPGEFDKHVGTALQALSGPHVPGAFDRQFGTLFKSLVIAGLCSTFLVLCAFAYTALHAAAKQHLNRVSFRLLICALVANLIYGCCFLSVAQSTQTGPSPECGLAVFLINISNLFSGGMFFCIALNLELVLVQGCNGKRLERYYLLGTLAVCAICNIPPYAAGQYGWNELNQACWFNNADRRALARWVIGTQVFWVLSMALGEAAAFSLIVRYFVSYENTQRRIHSGSASSGTGDSSCRSDRLPRSPVVQYRNPMAQYRNIILRVGLYPLVSCILSLSTIIDLYLVVSQVSHPIMSELNYRLSTAGYCIYALRPIIYAVLAATDPSFIRAVQELRRPAEQLTALQLQTSGLRGRFASTHTAGPGEMHIAFSREAVTTDDAGNTISNAAAEAPTGKEAPLQSPTSESRMDSDKMDSENLSAAVVPEVNAWDMGTAHALRAPALQASNNWGM
ncbi:hypothetical protein B0H15DRAFT_981609 [Mycena belliarum]|uniref:G-protein coupled receptors family 2 profile 2 domain-containing protein n=1 Tax=Mycena belliarum TaxID=1033014 RepID=A0AAD6XS06_9AGAR|nr:hypothetical protein B0H15DRAFT_981609 [Mycena belliae]